MPNNNSLVAHQCINCGKTWEVALKDAKQITYKDDKMIVYNQCPICKITSQFIEEIQDD